MSKLWEVNMEFARLAECCAWDNDRKAWIDYETGEIMTDQEYHDRLFSLKEDHDNILEWCAKTYLDDVAEAAKIKSEVQRLQALQKYHERRSERMKDVIDREQDGKPRDFGFCKVAYRNTKAVNWKDEDEQKIIAWLLSNGHDECIKKSYEIRKTELGKLIDKGEQVTAWAQREERKSMSIK